MLCLALCRISDKTIRLFQISDNDSEYLSDKDIESITFFAKNFGRAKIEVLNDTYDFRENDERHKCCSLCHCKIESIIQGAHIYPVYAIKQRLDLPFSERLRMATDQNNGLWLCENHHKLFDRGLIKFEDGRLQVLPKLTDSDVAFVEKISPYKSIQSDYYTPAMAKYFEMREEFYRAEKIY